MKQFFIITARIPLPADTMDQQAVIGGFMPGATAFKKAVNDHASKEKISGVVFESSIKREKGDDAPVKPRNKRAAAPASAGGGQTMAGTGEETKPAGDGGAGWTPGGAPPVIA